MWLFTTCGFFSVVQKKGEKNLTIRARVRADLERLRQRYLPMLSATVKGGGTDYQYRASVGKPAFGAALAKMVADLDYANFKSQVAGALGDERAATYHKVWSILWELQEVPQSANNELEPKIVRQTPMVSKLAVAYGAVVIDQQGRVLLRKPAGEFDGYVWTFAKGRPMAGESPQATAVRENLEETGYRCDIVSTIPGEFEFLADFYGNGG